jgi:predicted esterase
VSSQALGFIHEYRPAMQGEPGDVNGRPSLLLLHGTGGSERDLLGLGKLLAPGAALLSPRGKVSEQGHARFFRRLAEGVFDVDDLRRRTNELADFVAAAAGSYGLDPSRMIGVGYSNGANIAAAMLLLRPESLAAAALFRPMVPLVPESMPNLAGKAVFISGGTADATVPHSQTAALTEMLQSAGAEVTVHQHLGGHALANDDILAARAWLERITLTHSKG